MSLTRQDSQQSSLARGDTRGRTRRAGATRIRNLKIGGKSFSELLTTIQGYINELGLYITAQGKISSFEFLGKPGLKIYQSRVQPQTISAGEITLTPVLGFGVGIYVVIVDTEAAAASDDLDTITLPRHRHGTLVILRASDSARTVVVKDGTGNLALSGDFNLDHDSDTITLMQIADGSFVEISRSDNG